MRRPSKRWRLALCSFSFYSVQDPSPQDGAAHWKATPTGWRRPQALPTAWCRQQNGAAHRMVPPTGWVFPGHLNVSRDLSRKMFPMIYKPGHVDNEAKPFQACWTSLPAVFRGSREHGSCLCGFTLSLLQGLDTLKPLHPTASLFSCASQSSPTERVVLGPRTRNRIRFEQCVLSE